MSDKIFDKIKSDIKKGEFAPIYFLFGAETFFIDEVSDFLEHNVLTAAEEAFNKTILYGRDSSTTDVMDQVKRFPMMAARQLVVLKEAQSLKEFEELMPIIEKPIKSTVLVIVYRKDKLDKRKAIFKKIQKMAVVFESKPLYENKVGAWINKYTANKKVSLSPKASQLLVEYLGTNLRKIANSIDQMILSSKSSTIDDALVEQSIGISREYNIFELMEALGLRNIKKTLRITELMSLQLKNTPIQIIIPSLFNYFSKLYMLKTVGSSDVDTAKKHIHIYSPFIVKKYLSAASKYSKSQLQSIIILLYNFDLKSKGINNKNSDQVELFRELMFTIVSIE